MLSHCVIHVKETAITVLPRDLLLCMKRFCKASDSPRKWSGLPTFTCREPLPQSDSRVQLPTRRKCSSTMQLIQHRHETSLHLGIQHAVTGLASQLSPDSPLSCGICRQYPEFLPYPCTKLKTKHTGPIAVPRRKTLRIRNRSSDGASYVLLGNLNGHGSLRDAFCFC